MIIYYCLKYSTIIQTQSILIDFAHGHQLGIQKMCVCNEYCNRGNVVSLVLLVLHIAGHLFLYWIRNDEAHPARKRTIAKVNEPILFLVLPLHLSPLQKYT